MDTNDPRFQSAYNDLVGAFFRFINVVNPAPTPQAQVQLICNALQSLVGTLGSNPLFQDGQDVAVTTGNKSNQPGQPAQPVQPVEPVKPVQPVEPVQPVQPVAAVYADKRFAPMPTLTSDEVYRFIIKSMKKLEAVGAGTDYDIADFPLILEFNETEGIFTLNYQALDVLSTLPSFAKDVAVVEGAPTKENVWVAEPGKVVKVTGAWEIVAPMRLVEAKN